MNVNELSRLEDAKRFLQLLDPNGVFSFATFDDAKANRVVPQRFHGTFDGHLPSLLAENDAGAGVFVTVNELDGNGYKKEHAHRVRAVFVDLDGADLAPVESWGLAPHLIVESSPGRWHAYWLITGLPLKGFSTVQKHLAARFGGDPVVSDLPRVMRLPGFFHRKGQPHCVAVKVAKSELAPYSAMEVVRALHGSGATVKAAGKLTPDRMKTVIPNGERNTTLTRLAGRLRRTGMDEERIAEELLRINQNECADPLPEAEVKRIAKSIATYPAASRSPVAIDASDTGNAQRFAAMHSEAVRFVPESDKWLIWQDGRWQVDGSGQIMEKAKETARRLYDLAAATADDATRSILSKHAAQSLNHGRLKSMVALAKTERTIVVPIAQLDANDFLLGVQNGVIDLRDGSFRAGQHSDFITRRSSTSFDAAADCPIFENFLAETLGGDRELLDYMQRLVGYTLTGNTSEHALHFLYGRGANGKSTFLNVLERLLGDYAAQAQPETLMTRRSGGGASSDLARLAGKRLVISNEVREGAQLEENLVKQLTGGDVVTARELYTGEFEFRPKFKLLIAGNHQPVIKGDDDGIWRRLRLVPFVHTVPASKRDSRLGDKLMRELPGILNWAIKGCLAWQKAGLVAPSAIADATQIYRDEMDLLGTWIGLKCDVGPALSESSLRLYDSYRDWCDGCGVKPLSLMVFRRKLESRGHTCKHLRSGNVITGIALRGMRAVVAAA